MTHALAPKILCKFLNKLNILHASGTLLAHLSIYQFTEPCTLVLHLQEIKTQWNSWQQMLFFCFVNCGLGTKARASHMLRERVLNLSLLTSKLWLLPSIQRWVKTGSCNKHFTSPHSQGWRWGSWPSTGLAPTSSRYSPQHCKRKSTKELWEITSKSFLKSRELEEEGKHTREYFCDEQSVSLEFYHILKSQPRWAMRSTQGGTW